MNGFLKRFAGLVCGVMIVLAHAQAAGGDWRVVEMSGAVRTAKTASGMQLVSTGGTLGSGAILSTGLDGRIVLARGSQQIVVGPNSRMSLPAAEDQGMTRILQDLGTLMFKVDKRGEQHFQVETPIIAAVVKGTTFTVTAGADSHAVHVAEGLVEVRALAGAQSVLVAAGQTAVVATNNPALIYMDDRDRTGDEDAGRDSLEIDETTGKRKHASNLLVPSDIGVEPLDFAGLSGGLVQTGGGALVAQGAGYAYVTGGFVQQVAAGDQVASLTDGAGGSSGAVGGAGGIDLGVSVGGAVGVSAGAGSGGVDVGVSAGGGALDVGANVGDGGVDIGASAGGGAVDVGASVGGDGVDVGASVGGGTVDVGASVGGDGVDVGASVGGGVIDVTAGAGGDGVDVGAGVGDLADVGAGLDGGGLDVGVGGEGGLDIGAGVGDGGVDVGVDLGGVEIDLGLGGDEGIDLGLGLFGL